MLDINIIRKARKRYNTIKGDRPDGNERVTQEQLTALDAVVQGLDLIYADFALFVPFWQRLAKRRRFTGQVMDRTGLSIQLRS